MAARIQTLASLAKRCGAELPPILETEGKQNGAGAWPAIGVAMRVIIAGSRGLTDYHTTWEAIHESGFNVTHVISGHAKDSPDICGEHYARVHSLPVTPVPANWKDINAPGARIKYGKFGPYNALAGFWRNEAMAADHEAEALIALWDGKSPGTKDMIERAIAHDLLIFISMVTP